MTLPTVNLQASLLTPKAIESRLDSGNLASLTALRNLALDRSLPVYLVGGPVRDLLLGGSAQDLDFVVEGDAPKLARLLAVPLGGRAIIHARFGTATVVWDGGRVDLVTARREVYPRPGALPRVSPGSIYDDLARRDFSVNALALPLVEGQPRLLDPHGGVDDLGRGLIRSLRQESFADDPTRLLRAVRYEQRLGFRLEADTEAQLRQSVAQGCLGYISGDRRRHELERILAEERPGKALIRAVELGILPAIHPAFSQREFLARWVSEAPQIIPKSDARIEPLAWLAALSYPWSEGDGEEIIRRLNAPKSWARVVRDTIELRELEGAINDPAMLPSQLGRLLEGIDPAALYAVAGLTRRPTVRQSLLCYLYELRRVAPMLDGRELLAMGVPPGPPVGKALVQLRAARLDGQVSTEGEERRWVLDYLRVRAEASEANPGGG